jgi:serine/threonine-protein kinase
VGAEDLVGRTFCSSRYYMDALLGRGGMGAVYRARDMRLGRHVALKVLAPELVAHPTARARMTQEGQALARIEHPNVVRVFDVFDEGPLLVIVLELVTGGSLEDQIRQGGIGEPRALQLALGMLAGLEAVHRAGLVHRDVKPGNILLTADGVPKVADLGVARDTTAQSKTRLGQKLGTLEYMSPEQAQGFQVTASADIYAAGLVLFELLTGSLPFSGHSEFDWALAHVKLPPNLMLLEGKASVLVRDAIARALAKEPERRFASAQAMAAALAVKATPVQEETAALPTPQDRTSRPAAVDKPPYPAQAAVEPARPGSARSTKILVAAGIALVVAGAVGIGVAGSGAGRGGTGAVPMASAGAAERAAGGSRKAAPEGVADSPVPMEREPERVPEPEPDPTTGVTGYYEALNQRDLTGAFRHWGMARSASEAAWRRNFGENAQCARVLRATEKSRIGSTATVQVDVCVDDQKEGQVHRWSGTMDVKLEDGVWKMAKWNVGKRGRCAADCSPID